MIGISLYMEQSCVTKYDWRKQERKLSLGLEWVL